jgi:endo-1,4-beta-D-glucanase Y
MWRFNPAATRHEPCFLRKAQSHPEGWPVVTTPRRCRGKLASVAMAAVVALSWPRQAAAQSKPFPHEAGYVAGFAPKQVSSAVAAAIYSKWKSEYLRSDCGDGMYRVEFQSPVGTTVSEGMGYGMLLTVYFGDKKEFDGLWKFARRNLNSNALLGWKVSCVGFDESVGGAGSATDGDVDIALALVAAVDQWGDAYRPSALEYLKAIKAHDFGTCRGSGRTMATNGDWDRGCSASNTSYWTPAYDRVFDEFTHDPFWRQAANDAVTLWLANRNDVTGLVANGVNQDGTVGAGQSYVDYNGCRVPWRAVLDYLWYGTEGAKNVTDRITDWVDARGPGHLFDGYNTDGTARAGSHWNGSDCFNGGYATAAMSKSQDRVDRFTAYFMSLPVDNYYETSLRALYALTLSGNFWRPGSTAAVRADVPKTPASAVVPETMQASPADSPRRGGSCTFGEGGGGLWPAAPLLFLWSRYKRRLRAACGRREGT